MSSSRRMHSLVSLLCLACLPLVIAQPSSWLADIAMANKLWAPIDTNVSANNMPEIGNGFSATQMMSDSIWVSGVFNGYLTKDPSHRARVPSNLAAIPVPAPGVPADAALDVRQATYLRRSYLDPVTTGICWDHSNASCTTSPTRVWIEQRWYAHRMLPSVLIMEVEVLPSDDAPMDGQVEHVTYLKLEALPAAPSADINFTQYSTGSTAAITHVGWTQTAESNTSGLTQMAVMMTNLTSAATASGLWAFTGTGVTLPFLTVIRTSLETDVSTDPLALIAAVQADYANAAAYAANGTLHSTHVAEWEATIWTAGFELASDGPNATVLQIAQAVNSSTYAILSSARTDRPYALSPGGLTPGYNGHTFWDQETWMFPAVLLTNPDLAASLLEYRLQRLSGAYIKAKSFSPPFEGAFFPWESAFTGEETCPAWAPEGARETHIQGDIAFALWQFFRTTQDVFSSSGLAWLNGTAWPVLSGIADFWVSKTAVGGPSPDGSLHICDVIPPDEYHDHVCDSVFTSAGAILTLQYAALTSQILGNNDTRVPTWLSVASKLPLLFESSQPPPPFPANPSVPGGWHPEFAQYVNDTVKQADAILLGFPLGLTTAGWTNYSTASRKNDLDYYKLVTDVNGPAMTWAMFSIGYAELQDWDAATEQFLRSFATIKAPFSVWTETLQGGCANFLTGAGGFLQSVYFGFPGLRVGQPNRQALEAMLPLPESLGGTEKKAALAAVVNAAMTLTNPTLLPGCIQAKFRGLGYLGNRLDIAYTADEITVTLQDPSEAQERIDSVMQEAALQHRYDVSHHAAESRLVHPDAPSLRPRTSLSGRSQYGRVLIPQYTSPQGPGQYVLQEPELWQVTAQALVLVDSAGKQYPLSVGVPVTVPVQDVTIQQASS